MQIFFSRNRISALNSNVFNNFESKVLLKLELVGNRLTDQLSTSHAQKLQSVIIVNAAERNSAGRWHRFSATEKLARIEPGDKHVDSDSEFRFL
jgi:hypothetical protein